MLGPEYGPAARKAFEDLRLRENAFALAALMEVPDQIAAMKRLGLLDPAGVGSNPPSAGPLPPPVRAKTALSRRNTTSDLTGGGGARYNPLAVSMDPVAKAAAAAAHAPSPLRGNGRFTLLCEGTNCNRQRSVKYQCGHVACSLCDSIKKNCGMCGVPVVDRIPAYYMS